LKTFAVNNLKIVHKRERYERFDPAIRTFRRIASGQTFRIGRGVKKTDAIGAEKMDYATNGIWLFAGEGALYQRKPLPPTAEIRKISR
jgi:hypothetical protein